MGNIFSVVELSADYVENNYNSLNCDCMICNTFSIFEMDKVLYFVCDNCRNVIKGEKKSFKEIV